MKKQLCAIYARVSSSQQKNDATIDSQVDELVNYAKENALEVPKEWIFKDEGYSGSVLDRPGLDELRNLIREYTLEAILVYSPDRLARRYVNQLILEEEFRKYNVRLIYLNGKKHETPQDALLNHFQGIFAEYERTQILDRSRRGRLYKARQGEKSILVKAPYGYVNSRADFYAIDTQRATVVKEIFRLYTKESYSMRAIANHLVEKDISAPNGSLKWCPSTIRGILRNTAYIGTAYFGKSEYGEGSGKRIARYDGLGRVMKAKKAKKSRPKELWYPISVPIIISESDFEVAQDMLQHNKTFALRNTKVPSILQGLLICGKCGHSYYKRIYGKNGKKYASYYCHSQLQKALNWCGNRCVRQEDLDNIVWTQILQLLENPQLIEAEINRRIDEESVKNEMTGRELELKRELQKVKTAQDKILDAFQEGDCLSLSDLKERIKKLKSREKELKKEIEAQQALSILREKQIGLKLTVDQFRQQVVENAKNLTVEKKQHVLRVLIDEIVIMPGEITIKHVIPLDARESLPLCSANGC